MASIINKFKTLMRGGNLIIDDKPSNTFEHNEKEISALDNIVASQEEKTLKLAILKKRNEERKELDEHLYFNINIKYKSMGIFICTSFYNIGLYKSSISTFNAGDISNLNIYNCFYALYRKNYNLSDPKSFIMYASETMEEYVIKYLKGNKLCTYIDENGLNTNGFSESLKSSQYKLNKNVISDSLAFTKFAEYKEEMLSVFSKDLDAVKKGIYGANIKGAYAEKKKFDIYLSLISFIHFLNLVNEFDKINESSEFMTILDNYLASGNDDYQKLYDIYLQFYKESFPFVLTLSEFLVIAQYRLINTPINSNEDNKNSQKRNYEDSAIKLEYKDAYQLLQDNIIRHPNIDKVDDIKNTINFFPFYIRELGTISEQITSKSLVLNALSSDEILSYLGEYFGKLKLDRDRQRYLENNFSTEYAKMKDELNYENSLSGIEFENILSILYTKLGYKVEMTQTTRDQGADLLLEKGNDRIVIQAKFYSGKVGNSAVQEVVAAMKYYNANEGWVVTNSDFTSSAVQLAAVNDISLINKEKLDSQRNKAINQ